MRLPVLVLAAGLIPSPAAEASSSEPPFYVGIWSPSAKACKANPLQVEGAIFRIDRARIIWNETTCTFKLSAAHATASGMRIPATCDSEGTTSRTVYAFDRIDGRLRMNGRVMTRCKASDWRTGYE